MLGESLGSPRTNCKRCLAFMCYSGLNTTLCGRAAVADDLAAKGELPRDGADERAEGALIVFTAPLRGIMPDETVVVTSSGSRESKLDIGQRSFRHDRFGMKTK
jgi:hypothetical protein